MHVFDPYHVWLGIPLREQPPNHYRLLGIARFENHPDVIATAADRQMGHLRTFQSGKHSDLSQRLLNEVAAARLCLLNAAKKAAYDEALRRSLEPVLAEESAPASANSTPWPDITVDVSSLFRREATWARAPSSAALHRTARNRRTSLGPVLAIAAAGGLALVAALAWNSTRQPGKAREQAAIADSFAVPPSGESRPKLQLETQRTAPAIDGAAGSAAEWGEPERPTWRIAPPEPETAPNAESADAAGMPSFDFSGGMPADAPLAEHRAQNKRLAAPDDAVVQKIAAELAAIHAPDRAETPAPSIELANRFLQAAKASREPDERYVLLRQAREFAGQGGDVALALKVIETTAAEFDIDVLEEKTRSLLTLAEKANGADQIRALYGSSQRVIAAALSDGRYELAAGLANAVYAACLRSQGRDYRKQALDQREAVRVYCRRQEERLGAEARLKDNPEDGEARLALGRHLCLEGDWKKGLPQLAQGSDAELRELAGRDLASAPAEADGQVKLADAWWELGKARDGGDRNVLLLRAAYWYDRAHARLTSGVERLKVEKRLEELAGLRQRQAADSRLLHPDSDGPPDLWNDWF